MLSCSWKIITSQIFHISIHMHTWTLPVEVKLKDFKIYIFWGEWLNWAYLDLWNGMKHITVSHGLTVIILCNFAGILQSTYFLWVMVSFFLSSDKGKYRTVWAIIRMVCERIFKCIYWKKTVGYEKESHLSCFLRKKGNLLTILTILPASPAPSNALCGAASPPLVK